MRQAVDAERIARFMRALGLAANAESRVYFTGGATAVLYGWRNSTVDLDIAVVPEQDRLFRALVRLKDDLQINVELASPADFIPVPPGWEERSPFIAREGQLFFHHFDLYAQALSKVHRGHARDLADVHEMLQRGLVDPAHAREYYLAIEPLLFRFPAINQSTFRDAVVDAFGPLPDPSS